MGALVATLFVFTTAQAQNAGNGTSPRSWSFSLEQAKEYALQHNKSIQQAGLALEQAEMAKWATLANYLPQGSLSINYQSYLTNDSISIGAFSIAMNPSSTMTFQITQALVNMNILVGVQLADIAKQIYANAIEQTELAVKQNVNIIYYSIIVSEFSESLLKKNLENIRTLANATRIKVNVGIGEATEADQMDVTVANLENTLQSTERNIEMAYNSLRLMLGVSPDDQLTLTSQLSEITNQTNTFDLLLEPFVLENNIDMKSSNLSLAMSEKQLTSSIYAHLPTVSAVYQRNEKLLTSAFDVTMKNTLVLSASVPLFTGGKNAANVKKARLALKSSQLDNELARDQLLIQEKQLRYNLKSALESFEIQKKNIEVSQRVFDNITRKYEQGLSSSLELTNANNNLLVAQSNYVSAVLSLLNAQDSLQKLLGIL